MLTMADGGDDNSK